MQESSETQSRMSRMMDRVKLGAPPEPVNRQTINVVDNQFVIEKPKSAFDVIPLQNKTKLI